MSYTTSREVTMNHHQTFQTSVDIFVSDITADMVAVITSHKRAIEEGSFQSGA